MNQRAPDLYYACMGQPVLDTPRLVLRAFTLDDVDEVARLAGDPLIAETTANIPHPYESKHAEGWIATHAEQYREGTLMNVAVTDRADGALYGCVGLEIRPAVNRAEIGYWIGVPYWNRGYATEASWALLTWAFRERGLHRVMARFVGRNPSSGRVMEKLGMRHEGTLRDHVRYGDGRDDILLYGLLASEFSPRSGPAPRP